MGTQLNEFLNTFPWTDIKSGLMHILAAHSLFLAKRYESLDPAPQVLALWLCCPLADPVFWAVLVISPSLEAPKPTRKLSSSF